MLQGDFERIKITEDEEIFCLGLSELLKELKDLEVNRHLGLRFSFFFLGGSRTFTHFWNFTSYYKTHLHQSSKSKKLNKSLNRYLPGERGGHQERRDQQEEQDLHPGRREPRHDAQQVHDDTFHNSRITQLHKNCTMGTLRMQYKIHRVKRIISYFLSIQ